MPPGPISVSNAAEPAPLSYTFTTPSEVTLEAISARWDGDNADDPFICAIGIYAPGGDLLARTFASQVLEVGDSAIVTFAPFLGGVGSGGSGAVLKAWMREEAIHSVVTPWPNVDSYIPFGTHALEGAGVNAYFQFVADSGSGRPAIRIRRGGRYLISWLALIIPQSVGTTNPNLLLPKFVQYGPIISAESSGPVGGPFKGYFDWANSTIDGGKNEVSKISTTQTLLGGQYVLDIDAANPDLPLLISAHMEAVGGAHDYDWSYPYLEISVLA